jgi:protein TonB
MRKYTLVFSIAAHAATVAAVIIAPALATNDLPDVQQTTAFVLVRAELPQPVPLRPRRDVTAPVPSPVPLTPPEGVQPEPERPPVDPGELDLAGPPIGISIGDVGSADVVAPPPVPPRPKDPVRVGGLIQAPTKLVHVDPVYPPIAIAARKEGLVILEAIIGEDGVVREVRSLRPEPLFEQEAISAVRQWRFSPTLLNGERVPIVMTVTVAFKLTK